MPEIGVLGAALAGFLAFFSPCILPMLPFYLCYLGGLSMAELRAEGGLPPLAQRRLIAAATAFALGVTTIFIGFGLGASVLGRALADYREPLRYVAAALLMTLGLHVLGVLRIPLFDRQARIGAAPARGGILGGYVTGLAFGFGWTPCIGPALAAILMIAGHSGDPARGAGLLLVFGLAMTLPFVLAALLVRPVLGLARRHRGLLRHAERAMGLLLILFALLIATGRVNLIAQWLIDNFDWSATLV